MYPKLFTLTTYLILTPKPLILASQCPINHYCHCSTISMDCSTLKLTEIIPNMIQAHDNHEVDVDYSSNRIQKVTNTSFFTYGKTRSLSLRRNFISEIEVGAFTQLKHMFSITLDDNNIEKLPNGLFDHNLQLNFIYLAHNLLETLPEQIFFKLSTLEHLRHPLGSIDD